MCQDYSTWLVNRGATEIDLGPGEIYGYSTGTYIDQTTGGFALRALVGVASWH